MCYIVCVSITVIFVRKRLAGHQRLYHLIIWASWRTAQGVLHGVLFRMLLCIIVDCDVALPSVIIFCLLIMWCIVNWEWQRLVICNHCATLYILFQVLPFLLLPQPATRERVVGAHSFSPAQLLIDLCCCCCYCCCCLCCCRSRPPASVWWALTSSALPT